MATRPKTKTDAPEKLEGQIAELIAATQQLLSAPASLLNGSRAQALRVVAAAQLIFSEPGQLPSNGSEFFILASTLRKALRETEAEVPDPWAPAKAAKPSSAELLRASIAESREQRLKDQAAYETRKAERDKARAAKVPTATNSAELPAAEVTATVDPKHLTDEQVGDLPLTSDDATMLNALGLTGPAKQRSGLGIRIDLQRELRTSPKELDADRQRIETLIATAESIAQTLTPSEAAAVLDLASQLRDRLLGFDKQKVEAARVPGRTEGVSPINIEEAEQHLAALGIGPADAVLLCAYGDTNHFIPAREEFFTAEQKQLPWDERNKIPWNWAAVEAQHGERTTQGLGRDWERVQRELRNARTPNMGFIGQAGGTATKARGGEIREMRFLTYEIDKRRDGSVPPLDEQRAAWKKAGLPQPTLTVFTGGSSIHTYWRLAKPVPLAEGEVARKRLFRAIEQANPLLVCDASMCSGHQPQRLAGYSHPKTGQRTTIDSCHPEAIYDLAELLALFPELAPEELEKADGDGELFREDGEKPKPGEKLKLPITKGRGVAIEVPLEVALSATTRNRIKEGQASGGEGISRAGRAYCLSKSLQAAEAQLNHLGQPFTGSAEELYTHFLIKSEIAEDFCHGDLDAAKTRYWNIGPHGEGELSELALRRAIHAWQSKQQTQGYRARQQTRRAEQTASEPEDNNPSDPGPDEYASRVGAKWEKGQFHPRRGTQVRWGEVKLSLSTRLDCFDRVVTVLAAKVRNTFRRKARLRNAQLALKLSRELREPEMAAKILEAIDHRAGNAYQPLTAEERAAMAAPKVDWLLEDLLPAQDLTIIGGRAKVGKTRLVVALMKALLSGDSCLGFKNPNPGRVVIFCSDDQADGDTYQMLNAVGVWNNPRLLWSRRFRINERNLDGLLETIKANPGAVVVLDSLRSITRTSGIDENCPDIGPLIYDLKQAVIDNGGSLVLIHHCNKSNAALGVEALSGHNSIPGAANTVITLHYPCEGEETNKTTLERRLVREARSGQGCDLLVNTKDENGGYSVIDTWENYRAKQTSEIQFAEVTQQLLGDEDLHQGLQVMLELFQSGKCLGITALQLCQRIGLCNAEAQRVRDLDASETKAYKRMQRQLEKLTAKPQKRGKRTKDKGDDSGVLLVAVPQVGTTEGVAAKVYSLTAEGVKVVKEITGS